VNPWRRIPQAGLAIWRGKLGPLFAGSKPVAFYCERFENQLQLTLGGLCGRKQSPSLALRMEHSACRVLRKLDPRRKVFPVSVNARRKDGHLRHRREGRLVSQSREGTCAADRRAS